MNKKIKVAPSILSCDFSRLNEEVKKIEEAKADALHLDVMDGHFVPNFSIGPKIIAAINRSTSLFLDVHLMIYNPFDYVKKFIEAGADLITFHFEATEDIEDTLDYVKKCGRKVGLAFNPETSFTLGVKYLEKCDLVLFMSVHPGFSGQKFIPSALGKIEFAKNLRKDLNLNFDIQVDGGINEETAPLCKKKGANFLVSGNYLFKQMDMKTAIEHLKNC